VWCLPKICWSKHSELKSWLFPGKQRCVSPFSCDGCHLWMHYSHVLASTMQQVHIPVPLVVRISTSSVARKEVHAGQTQCGRYHAWKMRNIVTYSICRKILGQVWFCHMGTHFMKPCNHHQGPLHKVPCFILRCSALLRQQICNRSSWLQCMGLLTHPTLI
jgi:hypothetical protein